MKDIERLSYEALHNEASARSLQGRTRSLLNCILIELIVSLL